MGELAQAIFVLARRVADGQLFAKLQGELLSHAQRAAIVHSVVGITDAHGEAKRLFRGLVHSD